MPFNPPQCSIQTETEVQIDEATRLALSAQHAEAGQVILHVTYNSTDVMEWIRIWPTTYLVPFPESEKVQLIHAYNIGIYPKWLVLAANKPHIFTLVFGALPKSCSSFDLWEKIPEPGGFLIRDIQRNKSDVYHLKMH